MKLDFQNIKILVIGDFMVDHYLFGTSDRFSPEAPIPVVNLQEELIVPGGAGNVAMNLKSFGAEVTCVGCLGNDHMGKKLLNIFQDNKININHLELINNHQTTIKQRIYCESVQQSRLDSEVFIADWIPSESIKYSDLCDNNKVIVLLYSRLILSTRQSKKTLLSTLTIDFGKSFEKFFNRVPRPPHRIRISSILLFKLFFIE